MGRVNEQWGNNGMGAASPNERIRQTAPDSAPSVSAADQREEETIHTELEQAARAQGATAGPSDEDLLRKRSMVLGNTSNDDGSGPMVMTVRRSQSRYAKKIEGIAHGDPAVSPPDEENDAETEPPVKNPPTHESPDASAATPPVPQSRVGAFFIPGIWADNDGPSPPPLDQQASPPPPRDQHQVMMEEGSRPLNPEALSVAVAVTRDDLEQQVRRVIMEEAPTAEIVEEDKTKRRNRYMRRRGVVGLFVLLLLAALLLFSVVLATTRTKEASHSGSTFPIVGLNETTTNATKTSGWVYAISNQTKNWCGHNDHQAKKCGGFLASITTPEEKAIVDRLKDIALEDAWRNNATTWISQPVYGVWIGGEQALSSRNDTGAHEEDIVWYWADGSPWFDGDEKETDLTHVHYGSYWAEGEPSNTIGTLKNKTTKGQHSTFLTPDGQFKDENGCDGRLAPKGPGIYILPEDYNDFEKYPDCKAGDIVAEHNTQVPPRP